LKIPRLKFNPKIFSAALFFCFLVNFSIPSFLIPVLHAEKILAPKEAVVDRNSLGGSKEINQYLRKGHGSNLISAEGIFFALSRPTNHWGFKFFSLNQKKMICKFLEFCVEEFDNSDAKEALHCYWNQYSDG